MLQKIREVSVLFLVGVTSAFLLSFVYKQTEPVISKYKVEALKKSLSEVYTEKSVRFEEIKPDSLWKVFKGDEYIGLVFITEEKGYSGKIKPIVGVDSTGKIIRVKIAKEDLTETPGLGMKIAEQAFLDQFKNLTVEEVFLRKDKKEGKIDAITSATISSRAATDAIREGLERYKELLPNYEFKEFKKTYLNTLPQSSESPIEEITPNKLWKSLNSYTFLSEIKDSSFVFHFFTEIENKRIKKLTIFIENPQNNKEEKSEESKALKEELEKKFEGVLLRNINKLKFDSKNETIAEKMSNEINADYVKHIKWREK